MDPIIVSWFEGEMSQHGSALLWVGELVLLCVYIRFSWQHDNSLDSCQCKTPLGNSMKFHPRSDKAHGGWLGVWVEVTLLVHAISSFENGSSHIVWTPHASCLLICGCMRTILERLLQVDATETIDSCWFGWYRYSTMDNRAWMTTALFVGKKMQKASWLRRNECACL